MASTRCGVPLVRIVLAIGASALLPRPAVAQDAAAAAQAGAGSTQHGNASFLSKHLGGRKTASGERYDPKALTAAHRTLPLGTRVKVVNPGNDRSVVVTINDRGPVSRNRVIDLSGAAADQLGMRRAGVTKVETEVVPKQPPARAGEAAPDAGRREP